MKSAQETNRGENNQVMNQRTIPLRSKKKRDSLLFESERNNEVPTGSPKRGPWSSRFGAVVNESD